MALADSKQWRIHKHSYLPTIDPTNSDGFKNAAAKMDVQSFGSPDDFEGHSTIYFVGDTTPDNTDYPDSVAPIGSKFLKLTLTSGVVTAAELYMKTSAGTWVSMTTPSNDSIYEASVTVTTGELLALNATPKTLVAAQGAGKIIVPVEIQLFLDFNTTGYDGIAAGEDLAVRYTNGSGAICANIEATGFLDAVADAHRIVKAQEAAWAPVANAALVLHMTSGEIATGNSPLKVKVRYKVLDLQT